MRACLLLLVFLAGCSNRDIVLDADGWACTRVEYVTQMVPMPVGKAVMVMPQRRPMCVVYERMGWR